MASRFEQAWYGRTGWIWLLLPLSWLYGAVVALRRMAYRLGLVQITDMPVPVLVVGNFTVGGTGKTPLVTEIARRLRQRGARPGIVTRGYGGKSEEWPQLVSADSDPTLFGDEAVLMARLSRCPVAASPIRADAARILLKQGVDFILADDGLQHLALARDAEIEVRDGSRGYGNGQLLPVGPLREKPRSRPPVDLILTNGVGGDFVLKTQSVYPLGNPSQLHALSNWAGQRVHAVAAIGNPARFFASLEAAGVEYEPHAFPDHHAFRFDDFEFTQDRPVFMTEKDAVKCERLNLENVYVVPAEVVFSPEAQRRVERLLDSLLVGATQ